MTSEGGKRGGARRGARAPRRSRGPLLLLAAGVTLAVIAWGYLVYAAIDFGSSARAGRGLAWGLLALASIGAVACLFVGLLLGARLVRALGLGSAGTDGPTHGTDGTDSTDPPAASGPRPPGGRRAAR